MRSMEPVSYTHLCTCFKEFACRLCHACGRAVGLETAAATAAAETAVVALHNDMAELAGETVMTVDKLTVDYDA